MRPSGCPSRLGVSPARSTPCGNPSRAPNLPSHPVHPPLEIRRSDQGPTRQRPDWWARIANNPRHRADGLATALNAGWVGGSDSVSNNASIVSTSTNPISSTSTTPINPNAEVMAAGATSSAGASSGFIGGGQFGYNYQFSGSFVAGFEADIQGLTRTRNQSSSVISLLDNSSLRIRIRVRISSQHLTLLRSARTQRRRAVCPILERCAPVLVFWSLRAFCCMQQ